mmetsp:Transcript_28570/g.71834  ORF Transcript_28570/g.71834 Transcript_28570/m.71834 type:complete len:234 (+) Transcript_28570:1766-2467(+)
MYSRCNCVAAEDGDGGDMTVALWRQWQRVHTASSSSSPRHTPSKCDSTPSTGTPPLRSCSRCTPSSKSAGSPWNRLTSRPRTRARSTAGRSASVPSSCANTPPRETSPTNSTCAFACRTTGQLGTSVLIRLSSAQLPAPSITITSNCEASRSYASRITANLFSHEVFEFSFFREEPLKSGVEEEAEAEEEELCTRRKGLPRTTTSMLPLASGFRSTGFISTHGVRPHAAACMA